MSANASAPSLLVAAGAVALGALVADAFTTIVLFVVLVPLQLLGTVVYGMQMTMLGAGDPRSRLSIAAVYTAVAGPTLGTLAINITAMITAGHLTGPTFYLPLAAVAASALWTFGIVSLAGGVISFCQ